MNEHEQKGYNERQLEAYVLSIFPLQHLEEKRYLLTL